MIEAEQKRWQARQPVSHRAPRSAVINLSLAVLFAVTAGYSLLEATDSPDEGLNHKQRVLAEQEASLRQDLGRKGILARSGFRMEFVNPNDPGKQQLERIQRQQEETGKAIWEKDVSERGLVEAIRRSWGGLVLAPTLAGICFVNAWVAWRSALLTRTSTRKVADLSQIGL